MTRCARDELNWQCWPICFRRFEFSSHFIKIFLNNGHNHNTNSQSCKQSRKKYTIICSRSELWRLWRFISSTEAFKTNFSNKVYWCEISSNEKSRLINHVYLSSIHKEINHSENIFFLSLYLEKAIFVSRAAIRYILYFEKCTKMKKYSWKIKLFWEKICNEKLTNEKLKSLSTYYNEKLF